MKRFTQLFIITAVLVTAVCFTRIPVFAEETENPLQLEIGDAPVSEEEEVPVDKAAAVSSGTVSGRSGIAKMTMDEIRYLYSQIPAVPSLYAVTPILSGADYRPAVLSDEAYASALAWLNYYRSCAGLGTVTFTNDANLAASYGALVNAMNDNLSHFPAQPAGISDADYQKAYDANSTSNLAMYSASYDISSEVMERAITGLIADRDPGNAVTVGHRRWFLNPGLLTSGIGTASALSGSYYTSVKVFGDYVSQTSVSDYDFISWPSSGYNLSETFERGTPWSVSLNPARYADPSYQNVQVTLNRTNDGQTWQFYATDELTGNFFNVNNDGYGVSNCIIFRPADSTMGSGIGSYQIAVTGIKDRSGNTAEVHYEVQIAPYDADINDLSVVFENTICKYTGSEITPPVSVHCQSIPLIEGTDYTVSYSNNTEPGTATVTVQGIGSYYGTWTRNFQITKENSVSFNANGGEGAPDSILLTGDQAGIPYIAPITQEQKNFIGWSADPNASEAQYLPGDTIVSNDDITLYAVWADPFLIVEEGGQVEADLPCPGMTMWYSFVPQFSCTYTLQVVGPCTVEIRQAASGGYSRLSSSSPYGFTTTKTFQADSVYYLSIYNKNESTAAGTCSLGLQVKHTSAITLGKEAKAPTCTESGNTAEYSCSECHTVLIPSQIIDPLGHDWDEGTVTKEASCEEAGEILYTCKHDTGHTRTEEIPPLGHTLTKQEGYPAACEEYGRMDTWTCSACGEMFENEAASIPATEESVRIVPTGHAYGDWTVVREATEFEEGLEQRVCANDASHIEERAIPRLPHIHSMIFTDAKEPACEEEGNIAFWQCSTCGRYYTDEEGLNEITAEETKIPALIHVYGEWVVETPEGCETEGLKVRTCINDVSHIQTRVIPATGHKWDEGTLTTEPTCTEPGVRAHVCQNDSTHTMTVEIAALGHSRQHYPAKAATREETGNIEYWYCERCQKIFADADGEKEITEEETVIPVIIPVNISSCKVTLGYTSTTFTNIAKKPKITVTYEGETLVKDTDYTVVYSNNINAGKASVTITGIGMKYEGSVAKTYTINPVKLASVTPKYSVLYYTGKARTQNSGTVVKATVNGKSVVLKYGTDYSVKYSNNTNVGIAVMKVTGKGNYTGTISKTFQIRPKATTLKTVTSPSSKKLTIKWAKQDTQIDGYQIWYGTDKTFAKKSTKKIAKRTYSFTKTGLTSGKRYYVKIRTYKTVNGKPCYSKWSAVKSVILK